MSILKIGQRFRGDQWISRLRQVSFFQTNVCLNNIKNLGSASAVTKGFLKWDKGLS